MAALLPISGPDFDRRSFERQPVGRDSTLRGQADGIPHDVVVQDLSRDGCSLDGAMDLWPGMTVSLGLPGVGRRTATVVRGDGRRYGCTFDPPLTPGELARAFDGGNVMHASIHTNATPSFPAPFVRKWHPAIRAGVIVAATALLWTAIARLFV